MVGLAPNLDAESTKRHESEPDQCEDELSSSAFRDSPIPGRPEQVSARKVDFVRDGAWKRARRYGDYEADRDQQRA